MRVWGEEKRIEHPAYSLSLLRTTTIGLKHCFTRCSQASYQAINPYNPFASPAQKQNGRSSVVQACYVNQCAFFEDSTGCHDNDSCSFHIGYGRR